MSGNHDIDWVGASGKRYRYQVFNVNQPFKAAAGNYIFCKLNAYNVWVPIYVGQTEDLSERFENHHAMPCIKRNGATHIHVHLTTGGRQVRLDEETDLVRAHNPVCNG